jgi:hypothetical protein
MLAIESFLTAYDPSDLPSTSVDPLGFERGYLYLADGILPGLTNVAGVPRYFAILCAGIYLSGADRGLPQRRLMQARREAVLRAERLWVLANAFAAERDGRPLSGLRGVRYVQRERERIVQRGETKTSADYKLLSRQAQYGALGIYSSVAERLRFLDGETLTLTPDAGERLAEAFISETDMPATIRKSISDGSAVGVDALAKWGDRAFMWPDKTGDTEAACFHEALHRDSIRSRTSRLLSACPPFDGEDEQARIARMARRCDDPEIAECLHAILAYERCYRAAMLILERLLWISLDGGFVSNEQIVGDRIIASTAFRLAADVGELRAVLDRARFGHLIVAQHRLADVLQFLQTVAAETGDPARVADAVHRRHEDVQRGKFDKGRRKLPWLERVPGGLCRTTTRIGGLSYEAKTVDEIAAHPYRLGAADALRAAAGDA